MLEWPIMIIQALGIVSVLLLLIGLRPVFVRIWQDAVRDHTGGDPNRQ